MTSEANALGTAFLKANMLAEPDRTAMKTVLLDYARTRYIRPASLRTPDGRKEMLQRTLQAQQKVWAATMHVIDQGHLGLAESSVITAVNNVLDAHTIRLVAAFQHYKCYHSNGSRSWPVIRITEVCRKTP